MIKPKRKLRGSCLEDCVPRWWWCSGAICVKNALQWPGGQSSDKITLGSIYCAGVESRRWGFFRGSRSPGTYLWRASLPAPSPLLSLFPSALPFPLSLPSLSLLCSLIYLEMINFTILHAYAMMFCLTICPNCIYSFKVLFNFFKVFPQ